MKVLMEFATPIGIYDIDHDLCLKSAEEVEKLLQHGVEGIHSFRDMHHTTPDDLDKRPQFQNIKNAIQEHVDTFSEDILGIDKNDIELTSLWSNAHNSGNKHHFHQHPNSFLSGVVYVKCPPAEEIGDILFNDPRQAKNMIHPNFKKESCISNRNIWVRPGLGILILFPSWLEHGTEPYVSTSKEKRISISFNYNLKPFKRKLW